MAHAQSNRPGTENQEILTGHVLRPNKAVSGLRILQLLIAIAILGLAGFVVTFIAYSGASLDIFVASATILIILYILLATHHFTTIYNYWAIACLDIFLIIFWLAAWITSAVQVRHYRFRYGYYGCGWYFCRRDLLALEERDDLDTGLGKRASTSYHTFRAVYIAAAVLAAIEFVLFVITFFFTLGKILKHHDEGGHSNVVPKNHGARDMEMQAPAHTGPTPGPNTAQPVAHPGTGEPIVSSNPV
ncbi:hypothetical protein EYC80_006564 [Monilinia laxa]|uniref:MARVEL domain-containing protein n=1 Tax=Monilinia laxa TaxID=61186 RepID=A0A5N6JSA9_MONLA|nr:hypothetical protein EYC80_006564 [Monilinia laxa]